MDTWTLVLPYLKPPLTLNMRLHYRAEARIKAQLRQDAMILARAHKVGEHQRIRAVLHYVPQTKRRRDPINIAATLKPLEDGLVDARVIPDDTPQYLEPSIPVIEPHNPEHTFRRRLYLVITPLPPLETP